jgi:anti-sigma B factor antagonist/stage II sporulation protein AA (anti-sigma F factor antagonist)
MRENSSNFFNKNKGRSMNAIHRIFRNGVAIERVDLLRATINEAHEMFGNLIDDITDYNKIIVDLGSCEYIDSTFFGALVNAYRKIREKNGTIVLLLNNSFLFKSFIYREISSVFKVYHSMQDALQVLNKPVKKVVGNGDINSNQRKEPAKIVQIHLQLNPE